MVKEGAASLKSDLLPRKQLGEENIKRGLQLF